MDFRYMEYLKENNKYYVESLNEEKLYILDYELKNYNLLDLDGHWIMCSLIGDVIPKQGWKIHLTAKLDEANELLNVVAKYAFENRISFKYVRSEEQLFLKNSKYGDRSSSGKFITIYPHNIEEFILTMENLDTLTKKFSNGPYIFSDKRWKTGNVFFRYGGFQQILKKDGSTYMYCIENNKGELVEDKRKPYYYLPDFIKEPIEIKEMEKQLPNNEVGKEKFMEYNIKSAIHFSNGGGVYEAIKKDSKIKVLIKEARPQAGLDAHKFDAVNRLENEINILKKTLKSDFTPDYIDSFTVWENLFLVEEFIEGGSLNDWIARNYPFSFDSINTNDYLQNAKKIINNIYEGLLNVHDLGVGIGDLQPSNIIIDENFNIKFIDFETSTLLTERLRPGLVTPGFVDKRTQNVEEGDWFALLQIIKHLYLPIGSVELLSDEFRKRHIMYIKNIFGHETYDFIVEMQKKCLKKANFKSKELLKSLEIDMRNSDLLELDDINSINEKIINGIQTDIKASNDVFAHGDIRMYEHKMGKFNILTGAYGVILAMYIQNKVDGEIKNWIKKNLIFDEYDEYGLFTGKTGIAAVLHNVGYKKESQSIIEDTLRYLNVNINNIKDISILSGLSGIGLFLISCYKSSNFSELKYKIKQCIYVIKDKIIEQYNENYIPNSYDLDFVPLGFFESWTGAAYFITEFIQSFNENSIIDIAIEMIKTDLSKCEESPLDGSLNMSDGNRLLPYILGGSAGIVFAIDKLSELDIFDFEKEKNKILKVINSRCYYGMGLFRGAGSMFTLIPFIYDEEEHEKYMKVALEKLNLFVSSEDNNNFYIPGDFSYRFSSDIFSGSAGISVAIYDILYNKKMSWLPLIKD